ncbi:hypothetical protein ACN47E_005257 [Coniothyrium glycines]
MAEPQQNRAVWLASFDTPTEVKTFPIPEANQGTAVIQVLSTLLTPYTNLAHSGKLPTLLLRPPLVPNPGAIGRIHAVGSDSVSLKSGDLVFVDSTVRARDDPKVVIMLGHHGGVETASHHKLTKEWRDGSLQQYQKVPLENCYKLDEKRLFQDLKYTPEELIAITLYLVAAGAIVEAAKIQVGETIIIGPSGGSFGGAAVEIALLLGANVIALGRSAEKLASMKKVLGNPDRLHNVVMTGDATKDAEAIQQATAASGGAHVYNDWTPGWEMTPLYLSAALPALKGSARIVMSGGANKDMSIPHTALLHKNLHVQGKWMYFSSTVHLVISMISSGVLKIGRNSGADVAVFTLDDHHAAADHAEKNGQWKHYTVVTPNSA